MAASSSIVASLSANDREILATVNMVASSLSLLGSGFIVLCYLLFKELRKFSFKLVFYLALSDMLCSFFNIIGDPSTGFFCYAQGYSTHFFCVASFLWTTTIAFTLHRTVVQHKADVEDLEPVFHTYVWGTSLVMTIMRSIGNHHGHIRAWCWSQSGRCSFWDILCSALGCNSVQWFHLSSSDTYAEKRNSSGMSERTQQADVRPDMRALNRWGYYPLILIGSWAFGTINRIHDLMEPGHKIFWLSFLDVGTAALMGLFNSIAYGLNASVRRAICERLDLFWPERLRRLELPLRSSKLRGKQEESEMVPLRVQEQQQ
ncbi:G-protein coupled receptor 1 [Bienertia sinuspersici]